MKPIKFPQHTVIYAKNQPEYIPLPAHKTEDGMVTSCWSFTFWERVRILFGANLFWSQLTFNRPLQRTIAAILFISVLITGIAFTQTQSTTTSGHGNFGDVALVGTFSGLANLGITNVNGGFGAQLYVLPHVSVLGTLGGTVIVPNTGNSNKVFDASAAVLFDLMGRSNTNLFVGPQVFYAHTDGNLADVYTFAGLVGGEVYDVLVKNTSLAFYYPIGVTKNAETGVTTWTFGQTSGTLILKVWL